MEESSSMKMLCGLQMSDLKTKILHWHGSQNINVQLCNNFQGTKGNNYFNHLSAWYFMSPHYDLTIQETGVVSLNMLS